MPVPDNLDTDCVTTAIGRTPGIARVRFEGASETGGGVGIVPHFGRKLTTHFIGWSYRIGDYAVLMRITYTSWGKEGRHGTAYFANEYRQAESIPPDVRETIQSAILAVNRRLETDCRLDLKIR
jgi:hypothetical protein